MAASNKRTSIKESDSTRRSTIQEPKLETNTSPAPIHEKEPAIDAFKNTLDPNLEEIDQAYTKIKDTLINDVKTINSQIDPRQLQNINNSLKSTSNSIVTNMNKCVTLAEYFVPLLSQDIFTRDDQVIVTSGVKKIESRLIGEMSESDSESIINPNRLNLVEVIKNLKDGYEDEVNLRKKLPDIRHIGSKQDPIALRLQNYKNSNFIHNENNHVEEYISFAEVNFVRDDKEDPEIIKLENSIKNHDARLFAEKMTMQTLQHEEKKDEILKQKWAKLEEKEQKAKERKQEQDEISKKEHQKKVENNIAELQIRKNQREDEQKQWEETHNPRKYEKTIPLYEKWEKADQEKKNEKLQKVDEEKIVDRSVSMSNSKDIEQSYVMEDRVKGRVRLSEMIDHSKLYKSKLSELDNKNYIKRKTMLIESDAIVEQFYNKYDHYTNKEKLIENGEIDKNGNLVSVFSKKKSKKDDLRNRAKAYSQKIKSKFIKEINLEDPEHNICDNPFYQKSLINDKRRLEQLEKVEKNSGLPQLFFDKSKKIGRDSQNHQPNPQNIPSKDTTYENQPGIEHTPKGNKKLKNSVSVINGIEMNDYLKAMPRHHNPINKKNYWRNKISKMDDLDQNEVTKLVCDINQIDRKAKMYEDLARFNCIKDNPRLQGRGFAGKNSEELCETVDNMLVKSVDAKLSLLEQGLKFMTRAEIGDTGKQALKSNPGLKKR